MKPSQILRRALNRIDDGEIDPWWCLMIASNEARDETTEAMKVAYKLMRAEDPTTLFASRETLDRAIAAAEKDEQT